MKIYFHALWSYSGNFPWLLWPGIKTWNCKTAPLPFCYVTDNFSILQQLKTVTQELSGRHAVIGQVPCASSSSTKGIIYLPLLNIRTTLSSFFKDCTFTELSSDLSPTVPSTSQKTAAVSFADKRKGKHYYAAVNGELRHKHCPRSSRTRGFQIPA